MLRPSTREGSAGSRKLNAWQKEASVTSLASAVAMFVCVLSGALTGMFVRSVLPTHHLSKESTDVVKLAMGLLATMSALVLGLITASAKSSFDTQDASVKRVAASILTLDRVLANYGPETKDIRDQIHRVVAFRIDEIWPEDGSRAGRLDTKLEGKLPSERIQASILALSPQTDAQRWLQSRALQISSDVAQTTWLWLAGAGHATPLPFLLALVFWLTIIFGSFGLFAPSNATVITVLVVCALSVSAAVLLVMEMDQPFDGFVKISGVPMHYALSQLGQ